MKRTVLVTSLTSLVACVAMAGACTRERVILVKEPSGEKNAVTGAGPKRGDDEAFAAGADRDPPSEDADWGIEDPSDDREYARIVAKVATMVSDAELARRVERRRMALVNVTWEDTGRALGSALGPSISDLTLQVRRRDRNGGFASSIMPVIRPPNFIDRTGDVPADRFFVRVGNEQGRRLRSVPLVDVLKNLKSFAARPDSILGDGDVFAARDSHFLVSAQAVFLPIPKTGKAEFNPVLFNYQSAPGAPAVLAILVTRQGTSMQVIDNGAADVTAAGWGQELYFDNEGQRSAFTAERKSDVADRIAAQGGPTTEDDRSALRKGADVLFLVQVPLKHARRGRLGGALPIGAAGMAGNPASAGPTSMAPPLPSKKSETAQAAADSSLAEARRSDVEQAVLGHGPNTGPFNEGHRLRLERDPAFPIRITVQFYKATSSGIVSDIDLDAISRSIGSVYEHADAVGSLVVPDGDPRRPTAWQTVPHEWFPW